MQQRTSSSAIDDHENIVIAVAAKFAVPRQFVAQVLTDSPDRMVSRWDYIEPSNTLEPTLDYPRYPRYTPRIIRRDKPLEAYIDYIDIIDPLDVVPSEPEGNIRQHPTFARYSLWYAQGLLPPYPSVFEQILDGQRKLVASNRRRILAAREAGIRALPVWFGRWNRETGLPLKLGDIIHAAAQCGASEPDSRLAA